MTNTNPLNELKAAHERLLFPLMFEVNGEPVQVVAVQSDQWEDIRWDVARQCWRGIRISRQATI